MKTPGFSTERFPPLRDHPPAAICSRCHQPGSYDQRTRSSFRSQRCSHTGRENFGCGWSALGDRSQVTWLARWARTENLRAGPARVASQSTDSSSPRVSIFVSHCSTATPRKHRGCEEDNLSSCRQNFATLGYSPTTFDECVPCAPGSKVARRASVTSSA